jgi:serine-type D-Ala-D-Ala carboxypeptidase/endopeptidase (penicillin-binding protein 4)
MNLGMRTPPWIWLFCFFLIMVPARPAPGGSLKDIITLIGPKDAVMVYGSKGEVLLEKNSSEPLVPASILKIFTSLAAVHHLGLDYRFPTEFYLDSRDNLTIKGYGDPLLISETVAEIVETLSAGTRKIRNIVLDDSHFAWPLEIPGVSPSNRPYDAPNGALCVNFNTVFFEKRNGVFVSAEPQTPLLPIALDRVRASGLNRGRIVLSHDENRVTLYAGRLFEHFLRRAGVEVSGDLRMGTVQPEKDRLVHRHLSPFTLRDVIAKLLDHSNNFTTNQVFITAGIEAFGPPGTLEKGVAAAQAFARDTLDLQELSIREGSGISRNNRITARDMGKILKAFTPHHTLLRNKGREYYKTGTLRGVSTRAGYIENGHGELHRFVVMINTPGKSAEQVSRKLLGVLN